MTDVLGDAELRGDKPFYSRLTEALTRDTRSSSAIVQVATYTTPVSGGVMFNLNQA